MTRLISPPSARPRTEDYKGRRNDQNGIQAAPALRLGPCRSPSPRGSHRPPPGPSRSDRFTRRRSRRRPPLAGPPPPSAPEQARAAATTRTLPTASRRIHRRLEREVRRRAVVNVELGDEVDAVTLDIAGTPGAARILEHTVVGAVGARACGIGRHSDARAPGIFRVYLRILGYTRVLLGRPPGSVRGCSRNDQNGEGQNVLHVLVRTDPSCRSCQLRLVHHVPGNSAESSLGWSRARLCSMSRCASAAEPSSMNLPLEPLKREHDLRGIERGRI